MSRVAVAPLGLLMLVGLSGGWGSASSSPPPNTITLVAKEDQFQAPSTAPAGATRITLENQGTQVHHAVFVRLDRGKTLTDFVAAMKTEHAPAWATFVGGPDAAVPGGRSQATIDLPAGRYLIVCMIPNAEGVPHMMMGMMKALTVTAASGPAPAMPAADLTVDMKDYSYTFSKPPTAGTHTLMVKNTGTQWHELEPARLKPGKTLQDLMAWGQKLDGPPPATLLGGVSPMSPGREGEMTVDFTPGQYVFLCFLPDAKDGQVHAAHGMVKAFDIQ